MVAVNLLESLDSNRAKEKVFASAEARKALDRAQQLRFDAEDIKPLVGQALITDDTSPVFIYFPAEFESDETLALLAKGITSCGFSFVSFEYREYGLSPGEFSFTSLLKDADFFTRSVLSWKKQQGHHGPIVIMGRSFGTVPAIHAGLNFEDQILCVILESGFSSTRVFLERMGADTAGMPQGPFFHLRKKMSALKKPVLFLHSPRDTIQSLSEIEWLVMESRSKATQLQIAPSGTRQELACQVGDLYLEIVKQYVNLRRGIRPSRKRRR